MTRSVSKKLFFCIAGTGLAIGVGIFLWLPPLGPMTKPGISVLSFTNDPATDPSVLFSLTNRTASGMFYMVFSPEFKSGSTWPPVPQPTGSGLYLPPHQSTNFTAAIPPGAGAWRVPVLFGYSPSGIERFRGVVRHNLRVNWIRLKYRRGLIGMNSSEFDLYASYSPEMDDQSSAEPEGATNRSSVPNN